MSNYTKTTNFATKDSLPSGDANKIVKGAEINTEFDNIATAVATKANLASPTFTGTVTIPTADINGGTIDGTTIGGTTAGAVTATTLVANTSLNIASDGATVTGIKDEDDMASNSATKLATQQSIKAYVDSQVTAQDLDVTTDSGTIAIDLDLETLTVTGGTGLASSATGNAVTLDIDSTVATLTGTQTLTNKTLTSPDVNTPDIDGGTIDGTVIGGTTPAAVSATTVSATGNITVGGTVDGRDVATDGTKLDGIEAGATADQTAGEIKTAYESNADTNAFTDADHTKLDGIEAGADVTDTANVTAAGALMDSEVTNLAQVKAFDSADYATAAQGTTADSALQNVVEDTTPQLGGDLDTNGNDINFGDNDKANFGAGNDLQIYHDGSHSYIDENGTGNLILKGGGQILLKSPADENMITATGNGAVTVYYDNSAKLATTSTGIDVTGNIALSGTVDGRDIATDGTKLDGIEASADVTDTANVTAAGALMDSELTSEASVKALNQGVATTDSPSFVKLTAKHDTADQLQIGDTTDTNFWTLRAGTNLLFKDNGTERLRIDSSGQVGIGTSSPSNLLHVAGASAGALELARFRLEGATNNPMFKIEADEANQTAGIDVSGSTTTELTFSQGGTERMRIDSSGNVGIGTSSPAESIHTTGNIRLGDSAPAELYSNSSELRFGVDRNNDNGTSNITFYVDNSEKMRIDSSGRLGLGTTSPSGKIHAHAADSQVAVMAGGDVSDPLYPAFGFDGQIGSNGGRGAGMYLPADGTLAWSTAGSERMRIDSSGNVGIGTSSPATSLTVAGSYANGIELDKNGTDNTQSCRLFFDSSTNGYSVFNNGGALAFCTGAVPNSTSGTEKMRIDSSGNVGIGTSNPSRLLDVQRSTIGDVASFRGSDAARELVITSSTTTSTGDTYTLNANSSNGEIAIATASTERMRIDSSGNSTFSGQIIADSDTTTSTANATVISKGSVTTTTGYNPQNYHITFQDGGGNTRGSISSSHYATIYSTSSDYRLKEDIQPITNATETVLSLNPCNFRWINGQERNNGFIAHELQAIVPEAVTGVKDGTVTDEDGNVTPEYQGVDQSKLVPLLVKTIQELEARITQLENN